MARVDFLISNDRHHKAMTWPVIGSLAAGGGDRWRVLSLCELRGLRSPVEPPSGGELQAVLPFHVRRSPHLGKPPRAAGAGRARLALQALTWRALIGPRLGALLGERPDLVVLPNDAAFPYDRIAARLRRLGVPFLLLQEGVRFPLPAGAAGPIYGAGGAAAVAAWGRSSGGYFRRVGVPAERVHLTGSPRHDGLGAPPDPSAARRARDRLGVPPRTLALISNPIDDQGFCGREEKLRLFGRFVESIGPLFSDPELHLAVKLHTRESVDDFRPRVPETLRERVSILTDVPLHDVLHACRAAVVLASTAGLEALLCGLPLAVLEIPGHGFQYDYVESGAAIGLVWEAPMAPRVASLLAPSEERRRRVESYLEGQFAHRGEAADQVARLVRHLLTEPG